MLEFATLRYVLMVNLFVKSWNKEKSVTETVDYVRLAYLSMYSTDQAIPDQMTIPLNKLPYFEDRYHHWHWLDPIINSKSHVNLALLSHLLQILTCFENQWGCHLGVIYEKLVKLSTICWWKKTILLNLLKCEGVLGRVLRPIISVEFSSIIMHLWVQK